jgi:hypothetical protein
MYSKAFRIQFASNLNVHKLKNFKGLLNPVAPNLALLGNIGYPESPLTKDFLKFCDTNYERVFWVPGFVELSSNKKHTWIERMESCRETIWNLKNVVLCQKQDTYIDDSKLQLLLTTLWHPTNQPIYTHAKQGPRLMTKDDFKTLTVSEMNWLMHKTSISKLPVSWFTYSSPFLRSSKTTINHPGILTSLHGKSEFKNTATYSGGNPWSAVNMAGHSGYLNDAFWVYEEKKLDVDQEILKIITNN